MEKDRLFKESIPKLLFTLSVPSICAQIVTLLYNLVDRIFVGRMDEGTLAMAAIGICSPIVSVVSAFTGLFGRGGAPMAAIRLGENNKDEAEKYLGNSFSMLVLSSLCITVLVLLFKEPLLVLFGAGEDTLPYAEEYLTTYILGTLFVQLTVGMNYYITTQGFTQFAMVSTMLGAVLNIILDPIFIFTLDMGTRGAALATVLSQFASFVWVIFFIFGKRTMLRLRKECMLPNIPILKEIMVLGAAPLFMSSTEGLLHICFNNQVRLYGGDIAVGAMTILFSVFQIIQLPLEGLAAGMQPIIGQNYGARQYDRVRSVIKLARRVALCHSVTATTIVMLFPAAIIRIFNSDAELIEIGQHMLRAYAAGFFIIGSNSICQQVYTALGEGKWAFRFAFLRKIVLLIPLIYLLPSILPWGVVAVAMAESISDIITTVSNTICNRRFLKQKLSAEH